MGRLIEDLKAAGWVETTLGECHVGEEGLLTQAGPFPRPMQVTQPAECGGEKKRFVNTNDGCARLLDTTPVLRAPRPKYAPGTVALVTWEEWDDPVRNLLPVRAMMSVEGVWHGAEIDPPGESDRIEVVRVLLPADQDTPPITDEMVERAAEAGYRANYKEDAFVPQWDEACERFPHIAARFRQDARTALKVALENEKEK